MKLTRKEFNERKIALRERLKNAKDEEIEELRGEIEELEKAEIIDNEKEEEKDNEFKDERSILRGTIERLEKRSLSENNETRELEKKSDFEERKIKEKADDLRSGKAVHFDMGVEKRAVTVSESGILVPTRTKKEIADSFDKPSYITNRVNLMPMYGGDAYDVPFEKSIGEGEITKEGEAAKNTEPVYDHVSTEKIKVTAYAEVSEEVEKLPDAAYLSRVQNAVLRAVLKKIGKLVIIGSTQDDPKSFNGIYNADTKVISGDSDIKIKEIDQDTLNTIVFALGGDEDVESEAILILSKSDLEAFSKVKDADGKFTYKISRQKGSGKISYQNGSSEVEYIINSACNSLNTSQENGQKTMVYGALENFELPVFSDIEVKVSDDYKFKEGLKCIKATVMLGGTVSKYNGFVRVLKEIEV